MNTRSDHKVLFVRMTPEQSEALKKKASDASMTVNAYVRTKLGIQKRPRTKKKPDVEEAQSDEVRGVSDDTPPEAFALRHSIVAKAALSNLLRDGDAGGERADAGDLRSPVV